jgi:hypothetical protein
MTEAGGLVRLSKFFQDLSTLMFFDEVQLF